MKLHLPHLLRRAVVRALFAAATVVTTLASATHADMITPDGRTATQVIQSGSVYDVYTNTVRGNTGFNSFSTFDVYAETTANLHLADGTGKLINVVRDSSSHIDGVLNSYKDGRIGGDVYFLNPHGIIVGKTGVINVGSISMSTPTAAFVEQLIARDGSISATATQAVLAGDMPINEKGTISIKGKVNAHRTAELRAGKVEVKGGEINTDVKFGEMVNTGKRKVDTQGMSIRDGRLSFGKKPAKAKEQKQERKADIAIFADDVLVDGGALNADSVYIDPDTASLINSAVSGDYTLEARVVILDNVKSDNLTSFTLNAANELSDGTFAGNVSITLSNSNIVADSVSINATATTNAADAIISITGSTVKAAQGDGSLGIYATSRSGNTGVDIQNSTLTADSMEIGAMSLAGNAVLTLGTSAAVTADTVALTAAAVSGNADVNVQGRVTGGNDVTITASTGNVVSKDEEEKEISEMEFASEGGGDATVTVSGTVEAKGALTVSALAIGTHGDATLNLNGRLTSLHTETKTVGELGLERTDAETVKETDTPETANSKNAAYMKRYTEYLKGKPTDTAATATMNIAATAAAGNASITQAAASELQSSLSATISADAAKAASVLLAGKVASGDISAAATGETATLRVAEGATLASNPHQTFVREGTVVSVSRENGAISLEAKSNKEDQPAPEPQKSEGVLLEVAGTVTARREAGDKLGAGEGGAVSLVSGGKLTVTDKAVLDASSANGKGGTISFDAPEYELQSPLGYKVNGTSGQGIINLVNHEGLTSDTINNADSISREFLEKTLNLSYSNAGVPKEWTSGFTYAKLSGNITLTKDVEASIQTAAIADGTHIDGQGKYSLTLTNAYGHNYHLANSVTIGNNVSITGVKNFTFRFRNSAVADALVSTYFGGPTSLTVGENFTVSASGNVAITTEGFYNTYIQFGKGVDIQAGGDVTISAKNKNGMGTSLLTSASTDLIGKVVKLIPGAEDSPVGKAFSKLGVLKFDSDKFFKKLLNRIMGKDWDTSQLNLPQIGVRVSKASVTFGENDIAKQGVIKGNTVTISSSSTANVSGCKNYSNDIAGISIGYIYNDSKVDLGKNLAVTATGFKEVVSGKEKENVSVTITSSTNSKLSLETNYDSGADTCAVGVLLSVGTDFNTLNIDESVKISAPQNINIETTSDIEAEPFMSLGSGWEKTVHHDDGRDYEEDEGASASNILMFGANVMVHKSEATINGTLESTDGSISMTSEDSISSSLTMGGSLQYTLGMAKPKKEPGPDQNFLQFLGTTIRECLTLDFAIGKLKIDKDFSKLIDKDGVLNMFKKNGNYDFLSLFQDVGGEEVERCIDMSIATDIVVTENKLTFNGTATAGEDITVEATSEIEAACGAETSIVGIPTEKAIAGSISVPVVVGDTVAEIGSKARLSAGENIKVSSSTELPMSFDYMGWNDWAKAVKASGKNKPADFISAVRGSLKFIYGYKDNGDLGILDSLTSSHASTLMKGTGTGDGGDMTIGGDLVVDVRDLNTKTVINDGASLTAGKKLSVDSSATGTQVTFAGQLPIFLSLTRPVYMSTEKAAPGFGASVIVGEKTFNTVTYIGAATLEARQLEVDATGDAFMLEMSLAGTFGSADHGVQGGVNLIVENKMTVSEISGDAHITLSGEGDKEGSSITATDKSVLLNITGLEADGGTTAVGVGVAVTVNNAFTAAMLGNNLPITDSYESNWKSVWGDSAMPFARGKEDIILTFKGDSELSVEAENKATLVNVGISAAVQTGGSGAASVAANVGVDYSHTVATARQHGVKGTGNDGENDVTTQATDTSTTVSVAGDASVNAGDKNVVTGAGALSVNRGVMDTTAYVTDCDYSGVGEFTLDTSNKATVVAVDVAAGVGAAAANIAAGSAWNSLSGNTGSYLTGGSVDAESVKVSSLTDLTSFSCTLGAAVGVNLGANGEGDAEGDDALSNFFDDLQERNNSDDYERNWGDMSYFSDDSSNGLSIGEDFPILGEANGVVAFDLGASISRNALDMHSKAIVEGCAVTTLGALAITATDTSVITAVSIGAAASKDDGISIGAGGVFSFAPVSSTTEAALKQKSGVDGKLDIEAGSLTLHAKDDHRERVWSFGGGYGDTAGIGLVLSWGSFAGATTKALIENVNATVGSGVDILASSTLDSTFISVGGSGSEGNAVVTGMINYLNFNNHVITDIKGSTLTVTGKNGKFKALSEGKRTFTDGVGALGIRVGGGKPGAGCGAALSFIYVGGNGTDDTNQTEMLVSNSFINNSGTTDLLAKSTTTGLLAGANAAVSAGGVGAAFTGSFSWVSDASVTKVEITDTVFNQRKEESDKDANIKAEATSTSDLTLGFGNLAVQIGKGAGVGVGIAVLKDNATTKATMTGGGVESARDFTLHASGKADLSGLVIGGAGSGLASVSGGAFASTITHNVKAELKEAVMKMNGALTVKADNTSNVGKGKGTRFTIANGALGVFGGGVGVDVSCIDIADHVEAKAHNVSVDSGSMSVLANETANADAVTVSVAGGQFIGGNLNVVRPVLRGAAEALITSDQATTKGGSQVGITTAHDLTVAATNTQWMRSHLWSIAVAVNPEASLAANLCVNTMNLAGSSKASINGAMPLTLGGNLNVTADTIREATYTTVPVAASLGVSFNLDVNSLKVSNDTTPLNGDQKKNRDLATAKVDEEIGNVGALIGKANIRPDGETTLTISEDVAGSMSRAANAMDKIEDPKTLAEVDLHGKTATVGGNADIKATDTITTTPTTVPVSGGLLVVAPHVNITDVNSVVEATVNDTTLNAGGNITIDAKQEHTDNFHTVGVAIAAVAGTAAVYEWTDNASTAISLKGATKLKSTGGAVTIGTKSDITETFHHVNVGAAIGKIAFILPTFRQTESNTLTVGNGVSIEAQKAVTIATNSKSKLDASTYDITLAAINAGLNSSEIIMSTTPALTIGDNATITGSSVGILQNINREIGIVEDHIAATGLSLSFPFLTITDTVNATLTVGNGSTVTATTGDLAIASHVDTHAKLSFLGVNAIGISATGAKNTFTETVTNKTKLGNNVKLRAQNGTMTVRADNKHKGDMSGYNITANALNLTDELTSTNNGNFTADVTIGTGFDAAGRVLTLEAINAEEYLCHGKKVTVSLALNPYSKNAIYVQDSSTATITLAGGMIDVAQFNAKALTDVAVKVSQMLGGGSLTVDVNTGKVQSDITQTSGITLGTGGNELDILTDGISVTAHNKHLFKRLDDDTKSMVYGGDIGLISGTSEGTVEAKQTLNATVTMGSGSKVRRRADSAHYLMKDAYKALFSATNNVDTRTEISLFSGGILNANCVLTTKDQTTANATLDLKGGIDTWGDTELTAYSHARHNMINSVTSGALIPTFTSHVTNTIDTTDTVKINGAVESIGNITIQSGSAAIGYKMVDGTAVLAGDDDTNTTNFFWGKDKAVIHNRRSENITINREVRAGGELAIYNDSSANTVKKPFHPTGESVDYKNGALDTAADVTSSITLGAGARLYAGLGSAVKVSFSMGDAPVLEFTTAQRIFDGSSESDGTWTAPAEAVKMLFEYNAEKDGKKAGLALEPLTLPGMAFRIETKADRGVFNGKLYSPAKHGLDVYFPLGMSADVETRGVTLRGHESGLIFNRNAVENAVSACAGPDLYLNEGVAIRSDATGNLTLTGMYEFPYSPLHASSLYDLIISGEVRCGTTTMQAGGNFRFDNTNKDYSLQSPLSMYERLFSDWESRAKDEFARHVADVVANSGANEAHDSEGCLYSYTNSGVTYNDADVRDKATSREASIKALGTVDIKARVVDINGKIYSGAWSNGNTITIKDGFKLLDAKGNTITLAAARAMYEADNTKSVFKLDGYEDVTLVFDFSNNWITLSDIFARESGIEITGIIVNSDPTGRGGLYAMGGMSDVKIDNQTRYTLNIGNVDLSYRESKGITLNNPAGSGTTTYTQIGEYTYTGCANYQVKLQKTTSTPIIENGRLTFDGKLSDGKVGGIYNNGKVGDKETIIDGIKINTSGTATVSELDYAYTAYSGDHRNGYAVARHTLGDKKLTNLYDPGTAYRYKYALEYVDQCSYELYIGAANAIDIKVGGGSGNSSLTVTSGTVNFSGKVTANSCTVNAVDWIHAGVAGLVHTGTIDMTATKGSIGENEQALAFNARTASFIAGQDLFLSTQEDADSLFLKAGNNLTLRSNGAVKAVEYHAGPAPQAGTPDITSGGAATIAALGSINVTNGHAAFTTLESQEGAITANYGTPAGADSKNGPGILDAEAQGDVHVTTDGALRLYYVESRGGAVNLQAQGDITALASDDLSTKFYAAPDSKSTVFQEQREARRKEVMDEYYAKILNYERLYYEKNEKGEYTHRAADGTTFILPDEEVSRAEMKKAFQALYDNGKASYLGDFIYQLSGTQAVGKTKFASKAAALDYLKQNPDKLTSGELANAYYDKLVAEITSEVVAVHTKSITKRKKPIDFGEFDENVFRLYWMRDEKGNYVNQVLSGKEKGLFISPRKYDAFGNDIGPVYSDELCQAITKQFKSQAPSESKYKVLESPLLNTLADAMSGFAAASTTLGEVRSKAATQDTGKTGDTLITVRAATDITLATNTDPVNGGRIGGREYCFTINPIGRDEQGNFVYSDWATLYMKEISGKGNARVGTRLVYMDEETGECMFAMQYLQTTASSPNSLNELELRLIQQAGPSQINVMLEQNLIRVSPGGYIGVDAPQIHALGSTVRLASNRDFNLGNTDIQATRNLALTTSGFLKGAIQGGGDYIALYADKGIGAGDGYFGVGGSSTFSIASAGDVFLKPAGDVKIDSLVGKVVTVDESAGRLLPNTGDASVVGQRIDWHGSLEAGLNFRTYGGTMESGGLHWFRNGRSNDIQFTALNTDYTFWFVTEGNANAAPGNIAIDYTGHLMLIGLPDADTATFRQVGGGREGNLVEFTEAQAFSGKLTFSGDGAYTVRAPKTITVNAQFGGGEHRLLAARPLTIDSLDAADAAISVEGDATLQLAGIDNAANGNIVIDSTGDLILAAYGDEAFCELWDALLLYSTGDVSLDNVRVAGNADLTGNSLSLDLTSSTGDMLLNGLFGITGTDVSGPQIVATSANAGVFLDADTNDLSGSALDYFVADLAPLFGGDGLTVHDIDASGTTAKVIIKAIADELLLDGIISGAALEFYNTGDINSDWDLTLDSDYPFWDVWQEYDPGIFEFDIEAIDAALLDDIVWFMTEVTDDASQGIDDIQKLRRKVDGEDDIPTLQPLRFTDKDGNTVSREQFANLISNK